MLSFPVPETLPSIIASKLNMDLLNQGIGGDVFRPETIDAGLAQPDMIFVAYGTNDWNTKGLSQLLHDAEEYFRCLHTAYPDTITFVLTPIWRPDQEKAVPSGLPFHTWRATLEGIVQKYDNMKAISGETLFPPLSELFADQEIHPSDLGFREFADRLMPEISNHT